MTNFISTSEGSKSRAPSLADALDAAGIALKRYTVGSHRAPCPRCDHGPRDDALGVTIDAGGGAIWHCFRCDLKGGWSPREPSPKRAERATIRNPEHKRRWSTHAESILRNAAPLVGSLAERYLWARGCAVPADSDLRFVAEYLGHPAMLARVTDFATGEAMSLHFTLLKSDGGGKADVERPKLLLPGHIKRGGIIRLCDDAEVTLGLGIAEGIETALAIVAAGWSPIWSAIDAGNLAELPVVPGIESLTAFADHDVNGIGERAAQRLVKRWRDAGREARVVMPSRTGEDWADVLTRAA